MWVTRGLYLGKCKRHLRAQDQYLSSERISLRLREHELLKGHLCMQ